MNRDEKKVELCFNLIKNTYEFTLKNWDSLDEKASKIILFSGIIASLYSGLGSISLKDMPRDEYFFPYKYI